MSYELNDLIDKLDALTGAAHSQAAALVEKHREISREIATLGETPARVALRDELKMQLTSLIAPSKSSTTRRNDGL